MSNREWKLFINDIYSSINKILKYTKDIEYDDLVKQDIIYDATTRNLEIIGEAIKHLPSEVRKKYKNIDWKKIAGLRDIVIHEYFGINNNIIWDIVKNKIPLLKSQIEAIIKDIEHDK